MAWSYNEKTKQLFMDAVAGKKGTHLGEIKNADGIGEFGSIACGDAIKFTFKVKKDKKDPLKDVITSAKYQTFGCTSAIAASEALCRLIEEKELTPITALKIKNDDIVTYLGGLPDQKIHCSVMGEEALELAVKYWAEKRGVDLDALGIEIEEVTKDDRIICECFNITERFLTRKVKEMKLKNLDEVEHAIKAGGACKRCRDDIQRTLDFIWEVKHEEEVKEVELSPFQLAKKVEETVETDVKAYLRAHGGDIEIYEIKGYDVYVKLHGICSSCSNAQQTIKLVVESKLREAISDKVNVIGV